MGLARTSHFALVLALLFGGCFGARCFGQSTRLATCATFAADGSLATGTLHNGELKINLDGHTMLIRIEGGFQYRDSCEESFSDDGKWLAVVVPADELTILIVDRKVQTLHRQFSSEWHQLRNVPLEPGYTFSHLDGFLHDGSLALWRYVPRAVADASDGSQLICTCNDGASMANCSPIKAWEMSWRGRHNVRQSTWMTIALCGSLPDVRPGGVIEA